MLSPLTESGKDQYSKIRVLYVNNNQDQTVQTIRTPGGISMSDDFCSRPNSERGIVSDAIATTVKGIVCTSVSSSCVVKITSVCGAATGRLLVSSRKLQSESWQIEFVVIETFDCEDVSCSSSEDVATVAAIANRVSAKVNESITNGSFVSLLQSNISLQSSSLGDSVVACLVVWASVREPSTDVAYSGDVVSGSYYPDWVYHTGTCLNDGNEPSYMKINKSWVSDSLEKCCSRFYSGWNYAKCMSLQGSGLWHVDHLKGKCVTDCEEGNGQACGGLANSVSDRLYVTPRSCCESELGYKFVEHCEVSFVVWFYLIYRSTTILNEATLA